MLNQHEVGAHNRKVALRLEAKIADKLNPVMVATEAENRDKRNKARILPTCKPEDRAPRKIFKGVIKGPRHFHNVPAAKHGTGTRAIATPAPIAPARNVNSSALNPQRVPQCQIDMKLVAQYLAK